jgi:hypothetical protein
MYVYINGTEVVGILKGEVGSLDGIPFDRVATVIDGQRVEIGDICGNDGIFVSQKTQLLSKCITKLEFMNRFTLQELGALEISTDPIIKVLQRQQALAEYIDLQDQTTKDGIGYLVQQGIILPVRYSEILA